MFFTVSILYTIIIFVHLHPPLDDEFTRRDCYESFSSPKIFIELSLFAPVGPPYLFFIFHFYLYPFFNFEKKIIIVEEYHFKRIPGPCTSSLVFTTRGKVFSKMIIKIEIYLYRKFDIISDIFYMFGYGFIPGVYQLYDINNYFGILAEIMKNGNEHILNVTRYQSAAKYHLKSLKGNNGYICVISENNRYMIIKPIYNNGIPSGLITNITIEYLGDKSFGDVYTYPAFECPSDEIDLEDSIIIADDKFHTNQFGFFVSYIKYIEGYIMNCEKSFTLLNISRVNVRNIANLTGDNKKLYFIQNTRQNITCPDGTRRTLYLNEEEVPFYATEHKYVEIASDVYQNRVIAYSPLKPC